MTTPCATWPSVLFSVLVRRDKRGQENGRYEMVSGYEGASAPPRWRGWRPPAVVREMTYDEAVIAMVDANIQRENVLPSESVRLQDENRRSERQECRSDLTCAPVGHKLANARSRDGGTIGEQKPSTALRRLTHLNPDLLGMVDGGSMAITPRRGDQLSVRKGAGRPARRPWGWRRAAVPRPGDQDAQALGAGRAVARSMASIMGERKPNQVEQFRIPRERPGVSSARHEQGRPWRPA